MWKSVVFLLYSISFYQAHSSKMDIIKAVDSLYSGAGPNKLSRNVTSIEISKIIDSAKELIPSSLEDIHEIEVLYESKKNQVIENHYKEQRANQTAARRNANAARTRVKRQAGGKFAEAAKVDNLKMLRIYLTILKNLVADSAVGGVHPFDEDVPKPVVLLFKQKIIDFFFPPVGGNKKV